MTGNISRRFFLRAATAVPAAVTIPQARAAGVAMKVAGAATPQMPILHMVSKRRTIEGMLRLLAAISPFPGNAPAVGFDSAHKIGQISHMMLHIDAIKQSGIEFRDFSKDALEALEIISNSEDDSEKFNARAALDLIKRLSESGCRDWRDVTKYALKKTMPLLKDLESGSFMALARKGGNDAGVRSAVEHISRKFQEILGEGFQGYKPSFESASLTLDREWEKALSEIMHFEREKFSRHMAEFMRSAQETGGKGKIPANPDDFRRKFAVEALFPSFNKKEFFFRIVSRKEENPMFVDVCRLSKQLTSGGKLPRHWPKQGSKEGLVISTSNRELAVFLSSCRSPAPAANAHDTMMQPEAGP